jgi:hypothetical protein
MFNVFTVGRFTREASRLEVGAIFTDQLGGGHVRRREGRGIDAHRYAALAAADAAASRGLMS